MTPALITISFSHYCEKARWALQWAGFAFEERAHCPIFHRLPLRRAGGGQTVPALILDGEIIGDSADIVRFADRAAADPERRLFVDEPDLGEEIDRWMAYFDDEIGPETRRIVYGHLGDRGQRGTVARLASFGAPGWERRIFPWVVPVGLPYIQRHYSVSEASVQAAVAKVDAAFDRVEERLELGDFLVGDQFTAADLTCAALLAPAVLPEGYGVPLPPLSELPPAYRAWVERCRARPGGQFVLDLYREFRLP